MEWAESNVQTRHSDAKPFRKELGKDGTEQDGDNSVLGTETVSYGPRRSTRNRKEPDRYGDFEVYWQNRGNLSRVEHNYEGEDECHVVNESLTCQATWVALLLHFYSSI